MKEILLIEGVVPIVDESKFFVLRCYATGNNYTIINHNGYYALQSIRPDGFTYGPLYNDGFDTIQELLNYCTRYLEEGIIPVGGYGLYAFDDKQEFMNHIFIRRND